MTTTSDRRGFLRHLAGELARGAQEAAPALAPIALGPLAGALPAAHASDPVRVTQRTVPAAPAQRCASHEELIALATEVGLEQRLDAVHALGRQSVRLTPAAPEQVGSSRLGGRPELPSDVAWPLWNDDPLPFLARIDLAGAPLGDAAPLPPRGSLFVFYAAHGAPSGLRTEHAGAIAVRHSELEPDRSPRRRRMRPVPHHTGGQPLALSAERTLPRVWSAPVEALGLDPQEQSAWQELRERLADRQGVTLADAADSPREIALHRLLGYPDERRGEMPLACELAARGVDLEEQPPHAHPAAREAERDAGRWRLLLQLTTDDALGWSWGERRERLYLWIDDAALRARDFSRVWAIPQ